MIREKKIHWYVAYTRVNQELFIKKKLDELGIENFLPREEQVRDTPLGRRTIRVLLIHGMIFIRTDKVTSFSLINEHSLNIVYLKDIEGRRSLIVPDKQMEDFMFLLDFSPAGIEILNKDLKRGDRVRVIKGPLLGLEGELVRLRGHKRVVIRLEGVASIATSYIPGSFLEKIERNN
ncbi:MULTISPECIES: UpxY family transcription antiterminator [unclassified Butyricimonas]|uniref:UpxY family transcription antiterminator n=1 Tax=unclassified Butyricimonas TaxID=2637652 RepID=UPI000C075B87|nr:MULTISPECIES: UpxY family transcription antiterminator [unclassified Butyricimonas]